MENSTKNLFIDMKKQQAIRFVRAKGRIPASIAEMAEWLMEFDAGLLEILERSQELHVEHMMMCNRPIIINSVR